MTNTTNHLTIHPLERVPLDATDWCADVLTALGDQVLAVWAGAQLGATRGAVAALWPDEDSAAAAAALEGSTAGRVLIRPGQVFRLTEVHHGPAAAQRPGVMQLTWFDGPRSTEQFEADRRSGRRIERAVQDLPGYCGTVIGHAPDRAYACVVLADALPTLGAARELILSSRLDPDEDPALLTGPDTIEVGAVIHSTTPLNRFAPAKLEGELR